MQSTTKSYCISPWQAQQHPVAREADCRTRDKKSADSETRGLSAVNSTAHPETNAACGSVFRTKLTPLLWVTARRIGLQSCRSNCAGICLCLSQASCPGLARWGRSAVSGSSQHPAWCRGALNDAPRTPPEWWCIAAAAMGACLVDVTDMLEAAVYGGSRFGSAGAVAVGLVLALGGY